MQNWWKCILTYDYINIIFWQFCIWHLRRIFFLCGPWMVPGVLIDVMESVFLHKNSFIFSDLFALLAITIVFKPFSDHQKLPFSSSSILWHDMSWVATVETIKLISNVRVVFLWLEPRCAQITITQLPVTPVAALYQLTRRKFFELLQSVFGEWGTRSHLPPMQRQLEQYLGISQTSCTHLSHSLLQRTGSISWICMWKQSFNKMACYTFH